MSAQLFERRAKRLYYQPLRYCSILLKYYAIILLQPHVGSGSTHAPAGWRLRKADYNMYPAILLYWLMQPHVGAVAKRLGIYVTATA